MFTPEGVYLSSVRGAGFLVHLRGWLGFLSVMFYVLFGLCDCPHLRGVWGAWASGIIMSALGVEAINGRYGERLTGCDILPRIEKRRDGRERAHLSISECWRGVIVTLEEHPCDK